MTDEAKPKRISRKYFLAIVPLAVGGALFEWWNLSKPAIAKAARFVKPKTRWQASDFNDFLWALPPDRMLQLKKGLGMEDNNAGQSVLKGSKDGHNLDAWDIQRRLSWLSSSILTYPFKDPTQIDYHNVVQWIAAQNEIKDSIVSNETTFNLEQHLARILLVQQWDELALQERHGLLVKILAGVSVDALEEKAKEWVKLKGQELLELLRKYGRVSGYKLYRTLNLTIVAIARSAGVVLAEVIGLGEEALVGVITGPVGWAILAASAVGILAYLGRANARKTATFVYQLHQLKIESLAADGVWEHNVFDLA